jgi:hypothetical protein
MLSSQWTDLVEIVAAREADLTDERGDFLRRLDEDNVSLSAALRWALMLSGSERFSLQLQSLPALEATLNSKPAFEKVNIA